MDGAIIPIILLVLAEYTRRENEPVLVELSRHICPRANEQHGILINTTDNGYIDVNTYQHYLH